MATEKRPHIDPAGLTLADLARAYAGPVSAAPGEKSLGRVDRGRETIEAILRDGRTVYGVNTGFGHLANTSIPADRLELLQENIIRSHSVGVGDLLPDAVVRLILLLKIAGLVTGNSGVRREVIEGLAHLLAHDCYPAVPAKGSVGASGDLAPLSHMAGVLLGFGQARLGGTVLEAEEALERIGMAPLTLMPKEGLALVNGTQVSTALALGALFDLERIMAAQITAGGLSLEAFKGSPAPFDARIQALRPHDGQRDVAAIFRALIEGSEIRESHRNCPHVQDPYSLRCMPQVMGACLDLMRQAARTLLIEARSVTDNPLVFAEDGDVLSGGNFHAQPVAFAADCLAMAVAELGSIAERRLALLVDEKMSGLPPFLVENSGVNSGLMMAQVTAAALAAENKHLAAPAGTDSIPTSAGQEDHVSMATHAAARLHRMTRNLADIAAIELIAGAQGVDFHRPLKSSATLEEAHALIRGHVAFYDSDRSLAPDIARLQASVMAGDFLPFARGLLHDAADAPAE